MFWALLTTMSMPPNASTARDACLDLRGVLHVARHRDGVPATRFHLRARLGQLLDRPRRGDDRRAGVGEGQGDTAPDPLTRAGDDRNPPGKDSHVVLLIHHSSGFILPGDDPGLENLAKREVISPIAWTTSFLGRAAAAAAASSSCALEY